MDSLVSQLRLKCIHAALQVARPWDEFRNQPVAVLGMCTDEKEADARRHRTDGVAEYPTIKQGRHPGEAAGRPGGFPTLIVVDRRGLIR